MKCLLPIVLAIACNVSYGQVTYSHDDLKRLVDQSIRNYQRDWLAARKNWTYTQTDITESEGTRQVEVSEVVPLDGTPYDRLVSKDGHPLTPADQRKENRRYEHTLKQREEETPAERMARIQKYENERAFVVDIPYAYNFEYLGEEMVEGRAALVVQMAPRPGFISTAPHGSILEHIEGKLWIDKQDVQWAKAEARVIDTISFGWILARIGLGTRFAVEQTRVENGLWMPRKITITGAAHVMLFYTKPINEELIWSGYRKEGSVSVDKENPGTPGQAFR